jgi:hypothetical protein
MNLDVKMGERLILSNEFVVEIVSMKLLHVFESNEMVEVMKVVN